MKNDWFCLQKYSMKESNYCSRRAAMFHPFKSARCSIKSASYDTKISPGILEQELGSLCGKEMHVLIAASFSMQQR
jgi:hypothetical protein